MKYLKRINESSNEDMKGFIEECFIDYIDDTAYNFSITNDNWREAHFLEEGTIEIQITIIDTPIDQEVYDNIDYLISMTTDLNEFYRNIKVCCQKVTNKYPEYKTAFSEKIESYDNSKYLTIEFNK